MKNNVLILTSIVFAYLMTMSMLLVSCKKDDSPDTVSKKLLTGKNWKWSLTDNNPSSNPKDPILYHPVSDCGKDDVISFTADKYKIARGDIHCEVSEESPYVRDYSIDFSNKTFFINGKEYVFLELTGTQFKFAEAITQNDAKYMVYVMAH